MINSSDKRTDILFEITINDKQSRVHFTVTINTRRKADEAHEHTCSLLFTENTTVRSLPANEDASTDNRFCVNKSLASRN